MFYGDNRQDTRKMFYDSWHKFKQNIPLEPLEHQIVAVIQDHPEYHELLQSTQLEDELEFRPEYGETNPFLHMGLHMAIRDQVRMNRPVGVTPVFQTLCNKLGGALHAEHELMQQLVDVMWQAQQHGQMPDEQML